jgi:hypothetical protein
MNIQFFQVFEEEVYNQYLMMSLIVAAVVVIKIVMVNKAYQKKINSFIHPETILP